MGSGRSQKEGRSAPLKEVGNDGGAAGGKSTLESLVIPLVDVQEETWSEIRQGQSVSVVQKPANRLEVIVGQGLLGLVPPYLVETVVAGSLLSGDVFAKGDALQEVRVRLTRA